MEKSSAGHTEGHPGGGEEEAQGAPAGARSTKRKPGSPSGSPAGSPPSSPVPPTARARHEVGPHPDKDKHCSSSVAPLGGGFPSALRAVIRSAEDEAKKGAVAEFARLNPHVNRPGADVYAQGTVKCPVAKTPDGIYYAEARCELTCDGHVAASARGYAAAHADGTRLLPADEAKALWEARAARYRR